MERYYAKKRREAFARIGKIFLIGFILVLGVNLILPKAKGDDLVEESQSESTTTEAQVEPEEIKESESDKKIVCLDPGHGGKDAGVIVKGIYESYINLRVSEIVKERLEGDGYKVFMTRNSDEFVYKRPRARYCNSVSADIMVSIHHNAYDDDNTVNYNTVLYYKESDKLLSSSLLKSTTEKLNIESKGIVPFDNSLLWIAEMPAAMTETFFLTNKNEYSKILLNDYSRLKLEAEGIVEGIKNFFDSPENIEVDISETLQNIYRADLGE